MKPLRTIGKTVQAAGFVSIYGDGDATEHCFNVLSTAFAGCNGPLEIWNRFHAAPELVQAGAVLYGLLFLTCSGALALTAVGFFQIYFGRCVEHKLTKTICQMGGASLRCANGWLNAQWERFQADRHRSTKVDIAIAPPMAAQLPQECFLGPLPAWGGVEPTARK